MLSFLLEKPRTKGLDSFMLPSGKTLRQAVDEVKRQTHLSRNTRNKMINTLYAYAEGRAAEERELPTEGYETHAREYGRGGPLGLSQPRVS